MGIWDKLKCWLSDGPETPAHCWHRTKEWWATTEHARFAGEKTRMVRLECCKCGTISDCADGNYEFSQEKVAERKKRALRDLEK